jgi:hypothetical protein
MSSNMPRYLLKLAYNGKKLSWMAGAGKCTYYTG